LIHILQFSIIPAAFWQNAKAGIRFARRAGNMGTATDASLNSPQK